MLDQLPNFLVVGGAKCGTTSIAKYLEGNPEIFVADPKEPHYFAADQIKESVPTCIQDFAKYKNLFADTDAPLRGEASVFYLYYWQAAIPKILKALGRETRIVIILRNPVDRAQSAYNYTASLNHAETLDFEAALNEENERIADPKISPMLHYRSVGMYTPMVSAYMESFPNCHVELFDDLKTDPIGLINRLEEFLGVNPLARDEMKVHNRGGQQWKNPLLGRAVKELNRRTSKIRHKFPVFRQASRAVANRLFFKPANSMSEQVRNRLNLEFQPDVEKLSQLISKNLDHWCKD